MNEVIGPRNQVSIGKELVSGAAQAKLQDVKLS